MSFQLANEGARHARPVGVTRASRGNQGRHGGSHAPLAEKPVEGEEKVQVEARQIHVAARVRYFMAAPLIVARSDLLLTGPSMLIRYFAELVPLQILRPPIELPTYPEETYWHGRFDEDPAHAWLRNLVKKTARSFGLEEQPGKRTW